MSGGSAFRLRVGDVVAARLEPGPVWHGLVGSAWDAEASLFPIDPRLPGHAIDDLVARARPTVVVDGNGWRRSRRGRPAAPGQALIIATSGSRDRPQLVELSRKAVTAAVEASLTALEAGEGDGWVSCLPVAHIGGLLVVLRCVLTGAAIAFRPASDLSPPDGHAYTSVVPTILERGLADDRGLSRYRAILVGGSGLPGALAERARAAGVRCVATYGLTQSCGGVVYDGRPLPGVGIRVSEDGEVELGGPTLLDGYRDRPGQACADLTSDGWLRTGDGGRIGADGGLHVTGRLDDTIVTGGEKVWPPAVEAVLREHPGIADVAVIGRPDPTWGHRVVAVVVPHQATAPPLLTDLRRRVGAALGRHHAPRQLILVDRLPRSALGKVLVGELDTAARSGGAASLGDDGR